MRRVAAAAVAMVLALPLTGAGGAAAVDQPVGRGWHEATDCWKVGRFRLPDPTICQTVTLRHRRHRPGWVVSDVRLAALNCGQFETPVQAHVARWRIDIYGRDGTYKGNRYQVKSFPLDDCYNAKVFHGGLHIRSATVYSVFKFKARLNNYRDRHGSVHVWKTQQ